MKYTSLEEKVLEKGRKDFRNRLEKLMIPVASLFREYGLSHKDKLLDKMTFKLDYGPAFTNKNESAAGHLINDDLEPLNNEILKKFMEEIENIKEITDEL